MRSVGRKMGSVDNYYEFLGVSENVSLEELKRAYSQKRKDYINDDDKSTTLNVIYDVLFNEEKKRVYDISLKYGEVLEAELKKLESLKEHLGEVESEEEHQEQLNKIRKACKKILSMDEKNLQALCDLEATERALGNMGTALFYLEKIEQMAEDAEREDEKVTAYEIVAARYKKHQNLEKAIYYYEKIYELDATYIEDVIELSRLYYEKKKDIKAVVQFLLECDAKIDNVKARAAYLCETLLVIRESGRTVYAKVEEFAYKKLESLYSSKDEENEKVVVQMIFTMRVFIKREDNEGARRLEQIINYYGIYNQKVKDAFVYLKELRNALEKGKLHKAIILYTDDEWTEEHKKQIVQFMIVEAGKIKESLNFLKRNAPTFWEQEDLSQLEKTVNNNIRLAEEYASLKKDRVISVHMAKIIECLLYTKVFNLAIVEEDHIYARDAFFDKEDDAKVQYTLKKMSEYYPICYGLFSDAFLEGKGIEELYFDDSGNRTNTRNNELEKRRETVVEVEEKESDDEGWSDFFAGFFTVLLFPVFLIIGILSAIFGDDDKK